MSYIIFIRRSLPFFLLLLYMVIITVACSSQKVSSDTRVTTTPLTLSIEQPVTPLADSTPASVTTSAGSTRETGFGHGTIMSAALSPNKDQLAVLTTEGLWLYDVDTLEIRRIYKDISETDMLRDVAWSPDGDQLVLWYNHYYSWTASVTDIDTGRKIRFLGGDTLDANNPSWSPDGSRIAFPSRDSFVHVWDLQQGEELIVLDAQVESVSPVVWSPDGSLLATGGIGFVKVWDSDNWQEHYEFEFDLGGPGYNWIGDLAWSPDGKLLAGIAGSSGDKWIWNTIEKTSQQLPHLGVIPDALTWSSDGSYLVFAGDRGIQVLNVIEEREVSVLETTIFRIEELEWLPDKSHLLAVGFNQIELWDVESSQLVQKVEIPLRE